MKETDVTEITRPTAGLTAEEMHEILMDSHNSNNDLTEESNEEERTLQSAAISRIVNSVKNAIEEAINADPVMTRSLCFKYDCELALKTYEELYKDISRRAKQKSVTDYFPKTN